MLWFPLRFGLLLHGEGINQKKKNMRTTSFSHSNRRNQHCNGQCSHLGASASFMHFGLSFLFNLRYFQILPISHNFCQKYSKFLKIDQKLQLKNSKLKKKTKTQAKNSKLQQKTQGPGGTPLFPLPKWC